MNNKEKILKKNKDSADKLKLIATNHGKIDQTQSSREYGLTHSTEEKRTPTTENGKQQTSEHMEWNKVS